MKPRMDMIKVVPQAYQAVMGLETYVREHVDHTLLELVKLRASMLNGCAFCVDMHSRDALAAGESTRRLFAVSAWREAPFFTARERAALALTDAVTRLGEDGVPDTVWEEAVTVFPEERRANRFAPIAPINVWNRLPGGGRKHPPTEE